MTRTINVTATMEVPDDYTADEIYDAFMREYAEQSVTSGDLSLFTFADYASGEEIE